MPDIRIIKHTLEIRLKVKNFSFLDFKGQLTDAIFSRNNTFTKIKMSDSRVDIANENLTEFIFFSTDNFGMQIDGSQNFGEFKNKTEKLFKTIKQIEKYPIRDLIRVGTKSSILNFNSADNLNNLKKIFRDKMFKNYESFEMKTGAKLVDFGFSFNDCSHGNNGKFNILMGPVTKEEAINKFFGKKPVYAENFTKDCGTYCEIDFYQNSGLDIDLQELENLCKDNIDSIEHIHQGFLKYLYE